MKSSILFLSALALALTVSLGAPAKASADDAGRSLTVKVIKEGTATAPEYVPHVMVTIHKSDGSAQAKNTGADGIVTFQGVPKGRMEIKLSKPGYQFKTQVYMMPTYHATVYVQFKPLGASIQAVSSQPQNVAANRVRRIRRLRR